MRASNVRGQPHRVRRRLLDAHSCMSNLAVWRCRPPFNFQGRKEQQGPYRKWYRHLRLVPAIMPYRGIFRLTKVVLCYSTHLPIRNLRRRWASGLPDVRLDTNRMSMHPMSRLGSVRRCLGLGRCSGYSTREMTFGMCVGDKVLHAVSAGALTCGNGNISPCISTNVRKKYESVQQNIREAIYSTQYGEVNDRS